MPTDKIARLRELFQAATGPDSERQMVAALTLEQQMEAALPHLLAIAEAANKERDIRKQRERDETEHAASGQTFSITELNDAEKALDSALTAFEEAQ